MEFKYRMTVKKDDGTVDELYFDTIEELVAKDEELKTPVEPEKAPETTATP
jgi:hypothetical protein